MKEALSDLMRSSSTPETALLPWGDYFINPIETPFLKF